MSIEKCFKIVSNMGTFILEHVGEIMAVKNISICGTQFQDGSNFFLMNKFIIVKKKKRLIVSLLHVFLGILSPRIWHNDHREVNERMKEVLMMAWNGFECKWLECGTANCKMWMSMMVPDEVDMEHEVVKCGMCIVKEMNVVKGEKDLLRKEVGELRKEVGELRKEIGELKMEVGELRVQSINKDKEVAEVKTKEED